MIKILANDGIHPDGKMLLEEAGYQVDTEKIAQEDLVNQETQLKQITEGVIQGSLAKVDQYNQEAQVKASG